MWVVGSADAARRGIEMVFSTAPNPTMSLTMAGVRTGPLVP